jgi:hypothetical protein
MVGSLGPPGGLEGRPDQWDAMLSHQSREMKKA